MNKYKTPMVPPSKNKEKKANQDPTTEYKGTQPRLTKRLRKIGRPMVKRSFEIFLSDF